MNQIIHDKAKTKVIITEESNEEGNRAGHEAATVMHLSLDKESLRRLLSVFSAEITVNDPMQPMPEPDGRKYPEYVFVRKSTGYKKVAVRDIVCLEAGRNYCDIHLSDGTSINVSIPMSEVHEYLPPARFQRVHRSFVVNLEHVDVYVGNMLILINKRQVDIGREYREAVENEFVCIGSRKRVREKK